MSAAAAPAPMLLTVKQAAELLSFSRPTVYKLLEEGTLPCVRLGKAVRIARADLEAWVMSQREDWATGDPWDGASRMARGR